MVDCINEMTVMDSGSAEGLPTTAKAWYALYTIVRHEKAVNSALIQRKLETFLPLRASFQQWKDRRKRVQFPLFPGYLFVNMSLSERWKVLDIRGVVRIICQNGFPAPVPVQQIRAIKKLLDSNLVFDQYPYINEGKDVSIINGPLRGVRGRILKVKSQHKLILSIDFIQQALAVEIDEGDVVLV